MGTIQKTRDYSVKEILRLTPIMHSCNFAYIIMKAANRIIKRYLSHKWEINSKQLSNELCEDVFSYFSKVKNLHGYLPEDINYCYAPKIEGGDNYNLDLKTISKCGKIGFDVFTCSVGFKLKNHCCNFVRSTILQPTKQVNENHAFMLSVYREVLGNLMDGIELREVYEAVRAFAERKNNNLAKHLEKEFGFELGCNFKRESIINSSCKVIAREGMYFSINISLIGLKEGEKTVQPTLW